MRKTVSLIVLLLSLYRCSHTQAQSRVSGTIASENEVLIHAEINISGDTVFSLKSDKKGGFSFTLPKGNFKVSVAPIAYNDTSIQITLTSDSNLILQFNLIRTAEVFKQVVVSGGLKPVRLSETPVNIEVFSPAFFKRNPSASLFESLQNINGVRPQVNCNVCNTGDIHINGLEGPYTMVLIDGMPLVSSLSTVYGLYGIPESLIERIEVIKGASSTLYGSEALGGVINVITKKPFNAPAFSIESNLSSWGESNTQIGFRKNIKKNSDWLGGINYFNYQNPIDKNGDGFTDLTLQNRISLFNKFRYLSAAMKEFSIAGRYMYEDRWGGQMNWGKPFRGSDSLYGESIYTSRWELLGNWQLPSVKNTNLAYSFNRHHQNSAYGITPYIATQSVSFLQVTHNHKFKKHDLLTGLAFRYTYYDDNTGATSANSGQSKNTLLPGAFVQDEIKPDKKHSIVFGYRGDFHPVHGLIHTPRLAFKRKLRRDNHFKLNIGSGFRVVNLFTEEHAALTGARKVIIKNELRPERSLNGNLGWYQSFFPAKGSILNLNFNAFYTYFKNRIIADYASHPDEIIYDNLNGYSISRGLSLNTDISFSDKLRIDAGLTGLDVWSVNSGIISRPYLTESLSAVWSSDIKLSQTLRLNYTGNLYSPMKLPLAGPLDPRPSHSPWYSVQNMQLVWKSGNRYKIYLSIKNLMNFTPASVSPFVIARSHDPFDKRLSRDANGNVLPTPDNPYALGFDTSYVYAPNQGRRILIGFSINLDQ